MEYLIVIITILIYSSILTTIYKKRIEQTIPISIVIITLIIYLAGICNNLKIGVKIIEIMAVIAIVIISRIIYKSHKQKQLKQTLERIVTPGAIAYIMLCILFIIINKGRIFKEYDEFNHWARIIKNMFLYNNYGTNVESIVVFNEYPPIMATFQYIFVAIKKVFSEDTIITAQCIMYISIMIPITKNVKWDKSLKNLILIIPSIILIPLIFYKNFFINILVDGIIGIIFASIIFTAYEEKDTIYKYTKILSLLILLTLSKTTGIALAVLAIIIISVKTIILEKDKKTRKREIKNISIIILIIIALTAIWYIKINGTTTRWDFNQYSHTENKSIEEQKQIIKTFVKAIFTRECITSKKLTLAFMFLAILCINFYTLQKAKEQKDNEFKYYSISMLIAIPIYMIFLLITYVTIFENSEAQRLASFERYMNTILLANVIFQFMAVIKLNTKIDIKKVIIIFTLMVSILPYENILEKYINSEEYILATGKVRESYTQLKKYKKHINQGDKILFITASNSNLKYIKSINEYEINAKINHIAPGFFRNQKEFENIVKNYDYVFIYEMTLDIKDTIKNMFEYEDVKNDTLYKVSYDEQSVLLNELN